MANKVLLDGINLTLTLFLNFTKQHMTRWHPLQSNRFLQELPSFTWILPNQVLARSCVNFAVPRASGNSSSSALAHPGLPSAFQHPIRLQPTDKGYRDWQDPACEVSRSTSPAPWAGPGSPSRPPGPEPLDHQRHQLDIFWVHRIERLRESERDVHRSRSLRDYPASSTRALKPAQPSVSQPATLQSVESLHHGYFFQKYTRQLPGNTG